jgi:tetratricopeptide (TPR) repeat protein
MSGSRSDLHKAKLRRERIRQKKHEQRATVPYPQDVPFDPVPELEHPFGAERSLWQIEALMEGEKFANVDEANARLEEMIGDGRLADRARAWKQDDPKWRAQDLTYDALETDDLGEALRLVHEALELDPDCTDAQRLMVALLPTSVENRLHLMREVVEKAERAMSESFVQKNTGHFWGMVSTRPYMRAKQHLGELLAETGDLEGAIATFAQMLKLNPKDNQGMRSPLLGLYLATNRPEAADHLMSLYEGEEEVDACFAWARVLERWISGKTNDARAALARARKINRFCEPYLSRSRMLPRQAPEYYRPGDDSEAQVCGTQLFVAVESHPSFREWLRFQS